MSNDWIPTPEERDARRRKRALYTLLFWGLFVALFVALAILIFVA